MDKQPKKSLEQFNENIDDYLNKYKKVKVITADGQFIDEFVLPYENVKKRKNGYF